MAGYILTEKCAGIFGCSYIFEFNCSINSEWQLLSYASIAFSERHVLQGLVRKMS